MKEALKKRTRIKICGLTRPEDIQAVNEAKPDFAGFIVEFPKSRRNVTVDQLRQLREKLDESILPVGVFVNAPVELPARLLNEGTIALAQLHGQEDEEYITRLKGMTDQLLIKAFSIKTEEDVEQALRDSGLTGQDFAAFVKTPRKDGSADYGLRYEELITLCIRQIQRLQTRVRKLEETA